MNVPVGTLAQLNGVAYLIEEGYEQQTVVLHCIIPIQREEKQVLFLYVTMPLSRAFLVDQESIQSFIQAWAANLALEVRKEQELHNRGIVVLSRYIKANGKWETLYPQGYEEGTNPHARQSLICGKGYDFVEEYFNP